MSNGRKNTKMTVDERINHVLSKAGKVKRDDCGLVGQATWDAWGRGYKQAIEDIKLGYIRPC